MTIELVTTDGIFALDGGEWEVTNNIWLVGDDREVVVFDAAHDFAGCIPGVHEVLRRQGLLRLLFAEQREGRFARRRVVHPSRLRPLRRRARGPEQGAGIL